jgi:hypothetical protein
VPLEVLKEIAKEVGIEFTEETSAEELFAEIQRTYKYFID